LNRTNWVNLTLKFRGTCIVCGKTINAGEKGQWSKGGGAVRHLSCGMLADQVIDLKKKLFEAMVRDDLVAAKEITQNILDIEPNEKEIFNLAQAFFDKWDFEGAIKLYEKILENNPKHIDAWMSMASALRYVKKYNEAVKVYKKIIKLQPKNLLEVNQMLVVVYIFEIKDHKKGITIVKQILKTITSPGFVSANLLNLLSRCAYSFAICGEYERAIKINERILSKNPENHQARFNKLHWLGELMMEQRSEKDALKIINKYLKNDPKFFVYQLKNHFYMRAGKEESAVDVYRAVMKEEPETDFDKLVKSNALLASNDQKTTMKFCKENIRKHDDFVTSHMLNVMGLAYEKQHKLREALKIYEKLRHMCEEQGVSNIEWLRKIASINERLGNDDAALATYVKVLEDDRDDKEMLVKVIQILKKRYKDSFLIFDYLKRLHGLYPNHNNFTMEYAKVLQEKGEYRKAIELYGPIAETYDPDEEYTEDGKMASLKIAECRFKMGETKLAYQLFSMLAKVDNKFKEAWDGVAKTANELGKRTEAERAIKKAANLEKYEFSRDKMGSDRVNNVHFTPTTSPQQPVERSLTKGPNVIQKPTFRYNPKTRMPSKGIEKTVLSNVDSLLNMDGGVLQIGFVDGKPIGLFNDLKLFPKKKRTYEEFEKNLREILHDRLSDPSISNAVRITFPKIHSITVCEMFIPKSSIPVYVITKNKDEEFYVRQKKELVRLAPKEQTAYIQDNFVEVD